MSAKNTKISSLDFDQIKTNLRAFLQANPAFTDYNFEGSSLALLLDLLAYNTHYMAFYANMLANEGFLDTAVKRSSVVSRADELGYTPRSVIGASATVDVQAVITGSPPAGVQLDAYSVFGSAGLGTNSNLTFFNQETLIATADTNNEFWFRGLVIKEGSINQTNFVVDVSNPDQTFILPNIGTDMTTLVVVVQTSASDTTQVTFQKATDYTNISATDPVYFTKEVDGQLFQLYFGDGNVGLPVEDGNIIICKYLVSQGAAGNGLSTFSLNGTIPATDSGNTYQARITTIEDAAGGSDIEALDSIRFYAPKAWTAQHRLVTKNDYEHYLQNTLPNVESVTIWGGEENIPPQYGKVFISLKPLTGVTFSDVAKANFAADFINNRSLVSIIPEFVDPEYIYIGIDCEVTYDSAQTPLTPSNIVNLVTTAIQTHFSTNLEHFNKNFYYSKLLADIDAANTSIVGDVTNITMQKRLTPSLLRKLGYTISFTPNKILPSKLKTSYFSAVINNIQYNNVQLTDLPDQLNFSTSYSGSGTLQISDASGVVLLSNVGTIDYATGVLSIDPLEIVSVAANDGVIRFTCTLQETSLNVVVQQNNIVVIDDTVADPLAGILNNGMVVTATPL